MTIGVAVFGSSVSSTVIGIIYKLVPLIIILKYITKKEIVEKLSDDFS